MRSPTTTALRGRGAAGANLTAALQLAAAAVVVVVAMASAGAPPGCAPPGGACDPAVCALNASVPDAYCWAPAAGAGVCMAGPSVAAAYGSNCSTGTGAGGCPAGAPWAALYVSVAPGEAAGSSVYPNGLACNGVCGWSTASKGGGDPCTLDGECVSGACTGTGGVCAGGGVGAACSHGRMAPDSCGVGSYCQLQTGETGVCATASAPGGPCPYYPSVSLASALNSCGSGYICYAPPPPLPTTTRGTSATPATGKCVPLGSLPAGTLVALGPANNNGMVAHVGLLFCRGGLAAPVAYAGNVTYDTYACVQGYDWSAVGTPCPAAPCSASFATAGMGPPGTHTYCMPNATDACVWTPGVVYDPAAVVAAWTPLASCAVSGVSKSGAACNMGSLLSGFVLDVAVAGAATLPVPAYTCLYYTCHTDFTAFTAAVNTPNAYWAGLRASTWPACALSSSAAALALLATSPCDLPPAIGAAGWGCRQAAVSPTPSATPFPPSASPSPSPTPSAPPTPSTSPSPPPTPSISPSASPTPSISPSAPPTPSATPSPPSPAAASVWTPGVIGGTAAGGVGVVGVAAAAACCFLRRRRPVRAGEGSTCTTGSAAATDDDDEAAAGGVHGGGASTAGEYHALPADAGAGLEGDSRLASVASGIQ